MPDPVKTEGAESTSAPRSPLKPISEWREGFYSKPTGEAGDTTGTATPSTEPVQGFMDKLIHGVEGENRLPSIDDEGVHAGSLLRAGARGLANVGNAVYQAAQETGHALSRNPAMEALDPKLKEAQDAKAKEKRKSRLVSEEDMNMTYGARSDDPIAAFTESAVQGAASMLLFNAAGAGVIGSAALTDAVAFDPYEDGLSEIAAAYGTKIPGIGGIVAGAGELLSVEEQDSYLTSRIKRAVEGGIAGAAFDAVFWSAKKLLGLRAKNVEAVAEADGHLKETVEGTGTPQGAHVVARPNEDGTWRVEPVDEADFIPSAPREAPPVDPLSPSERMLIERGALTSDSYTQDIVEGAGHRYLGADDAPTYDFLPGPKDAPGRHVYRVPGKAVLIVREGADGLPAYPTLMFTKPEARGSKLAQGLLKDAQADFKAKGLGPIGINAGDLSPMRVEQLKKHGTQGRPVFDPDTKEIAERVREPALVPGPARGNPRNPMTASETAAHELGYDHPRFADRAEAEAQANTINHTLKARKAAAGPRLFTDEEVLAHVEAARKIFQNESPRHMTAALEGTHFNFRFLGGSDRVKAQIEALSVQFQKEFDAVQGKTDGSIPHEVTVKVAAKLARSYGITDWAARVSEMAKQGKNAHIELLLANRAVEQLGGEMANLSKLLLRRPHDPALLKDARDLMRVWVKLTLDTAGLNSQAGRNLGILGIRDRADVGAIKFPKESPAPKAGEAPKAAPQGNRKATAKEHADANQMNAQADLFDSMTDDEITAALRQFEMAGGNVRNAEAVIEGLKVLADPKRGPVGAAIERSANVFINALISGAKTMETIFSSGQAMLFFEYANRSLAGAGRFVFTGDPRLMREGADMAYAHFAYAWDNMKAAGAAFKSNRSLIDPSPSMYATGGVVNTTISMPGRTAGMIDEFTRVTGYRARMRALAARKARDAGLTGKAYAKQVELDVRNSIDAKTGVGINAEAAEWAGIPTLSNPLGQGTWGGDLSNLLAKYPATKFIIPFIRPGINTFRYVGKASGGDAIRLLFKESRDVLTKGSAEEAAVIMTRTAIAGSFYTYMWYKAMDGTITGRGPSNPTLRNTWLKNHQPYSVKIGDTYHSYRRMEPWGTFMGLMADAQSVQMELSDQEGTEADDIGKAVFASLLANFVNKSYMQGLSTFMTAVDDQDLSSAESFLGGIAGGFVPQAVQQFNTDVYYREADGIIEEVMKRVPGLSDNLPPKYNALGEPVMKQGSLWNRNFSIAREADANQDRNIALDGKALSVEDRLLDDGVRISPPPSKEFGGAIDYLDPRYAKNGKLPYVRWMELVSEGWDGHPGLRAKMEKVMEKGGKYDKAQEGSKAYPGGERGLIIAGLKDDHEEQAKHRMMREYPELARAWKGAVGLRGSSLQGGQSAVDARRLKFGIPTP